MIGSSYLAYLKSTRPTGRYMARELGLTSWGIKSVDIPLDVLIRWGNCKPFDRVGVEINPASAIMRASDKPTAIETMQGAGIHTVHCFRTWHEVIQSNAGSPVFGRTRRGFGGTDIVIYDPWRYFPPGQYPEKPIHLHDWYTTWVPSSREVRIHVCDGKVIRIQGKYLDFPDQDDNGLIRNYAHGYRFRTPKQELHRHRKVTAVSAVKALGLDFGAVDMLLTSSRSEADPGTVLEVNTAPACSPLTARCYAGGIAMLVQQRTRGAITLAPQLMESEVPDMEDE